MLDIILNRTSCRSYLNKPIEANKIAQLKAAINNSPTARNLQDFSCIFITDIKVHEQLCKYADNQPHVKNAPLFILFLGDQNRLNNHTN
jgi:nitroreductase